MIRITSKKDGFRRAGIAHADSARDYPDNFFTPQQIKTLRQEPMLIVQEELPDTDDIKAQAEEIAKSAKKSKAKG